MLRWLEGTEPAASRVEAALQDRPVMSLVTVGEVFSIVRRARDDSVALAVRGRSKTSADVATYTAMATVARSFGDP